VTLSDALRSLLQTYARAADDRDITTLAALFHPEAEIIGSRGTQSLSEWLDTMRAPRVFPTSMHLIGDPLISIAEGAAQARLDTYAVVYQISEQASGTGDLTLGIRYLDDAVLWHEHWVIRRREARTLWMR